MSRRGRAIDRVAASGLAATALALALLAPLPAAADPAAAIAEAGRALERAAASLEGAQTGPERLAALGRAVAATETALSAYRRALLALEAEERRLSRGLAEESGAVARLVAALQRLETAPPSALLAFPGGPVDAIRAAGLMAAITPALERRRIDLALTLDRLRELRAREETARAEAGAALAALQDLRAETSRAVEEGQGRPAPRRVLDAEAEAAARRARDLGTLAALVESALPADAAAGDFEDARLALPVAGRVTARFGEADPWGRPGQGLALTAPAWASVRSPVAATVRYAGPLADYGEVVVLEPEPGWLVVLAGLGALSVEAGEIVPPGAPLGDLGGRLPESAEFLLEGSGDRDEIGAETLYIEIREDGEAVDPASWFDTD